MPRRSRIDAPGALHHIIVRGIERRAVFKNDADREKLLEKLGTVLTESRTPCFAYALMRNHVHLLLRTGTVPLATVMRRLLTGYAMYSSTGATGGTGTCSKDYRGHISICELRSTWYRSIR